MNLTTLMSIQILFGAGDEITRSKYRRMSCLFGQPHHNMVVQFQSNIALPSCKSRLNPALMGLVEGLYVWRLAAT